MDVDEVEEDDDDDEQEHLEDCEHQNREEMVGLLTLIDISMFPCLN